MTNKQSQSGGDQSTNIQAGMVVIAGLSSADVKIIAKDIFDANFERLVQVAKVTVDQRANEIRNDISAKLAEIDQSKLEGFKEPAKQMALLDAQRTYVLTGDPDLKGVLVQMIVDIANEEGRTIKAIVIQEAIKVLPTLTMQQIKIIATVFMFRYVSNHGHDSLSSLARWFQQHLRDPIPDFSYTNGDFRHIEYSRCGTVGLAGVRAEDLFHQVYPGLFSKGSPLEDFASAFKDVEMPSSIIMKCLNVPSTYQIAALNGQALELKAKAENWSNKQVEIAKSRLGVNLMSTTEVKEKIRLHSATMAEFIDEWNTTALHKLNLTSVGMIIGHSYISSRIPNFPPPDNWL